MGFKEFIQDDAAVRLGIFLGKTLSLPTGLATAKWVGKVIASRRQSNIVRNIKANQWVVSGGVLDREGLDRRAKEVLVSHAQSLFEYYYYYNRQKQGTKIAMPTAEMLAVIEGIRSEKKPTIFLTPHVGNLDLLAMGITGYGLRPYVLSYPKPNEAYKAENRIRDSLGMEVHPITFTAFRQAKQALKAGTCIITGIDRAIDTGEQQKYLPKFFGRPAALPVFYIRMALEVGAEVRISYGRRQEDGSYVIECSQPINFEKRDNIIEETILNAEKVLSRTEAIIKDKPEKWAMIHPVWPEVFPLIENLL